MLKSTSFLVFLRYTLSMASKTPAWENRKEIANQVIAELTDGGMLKGIKADSNQIGQLLFDDLKKRGVTIARNDTSTMLLCMTAALEELKEFCQDYIYLNIQDARDHGTTWQEIGDTFGISPRTAMDRYNKSTVEARRRYEKKRAKKRHEQTKTKS